MLEETKYSIPGAILMRYKEQVLAPIYSSCEWVVEYHFDSYSSYTQPCRAYSAVANAMPGYFHTDSVNTAGENRLYLSFSNCRGILIAQMVHCPAPSQPITPFYIGRCGPFPNSKDSPQEMAPYRAVRSHGTRNESPRL